MRNEIKLEPCRICGDVADVAIGTDGAEVRCLCCGFTTGYCKDTRRAIPNYTQPTWRWESEGDYGVHEAIRKWNGSVVTE